MSSRLKDLQQSSCTSRVLLARSTSSLRRGPPGSCPSSQPLRRHVGARVLNPEASRLTAFSSPPRSVRRAGWAGALVAPGRRPPGLWRSLPSAAVLVLAFLSAVSAPLRARLPLSPPERHGREGTRGARRTGKPGRATAGPPTQGHDRPGRHGERDPENPGRERRAKARGEGPAWRRHSGPQAGAAWVGQSQPRHGLRP
jgi:hypothetical protein